MTTLNEIILPDGSRRRLGNLLPSTSVAPNRTLGAKVLGDDDTVRLIPREEWPRLVPDLDGPDDPFTPYIHDQNGVGQCNADATASLVEYTRARQGLPFVRLSAADLYDRINGGADRGSLLEDALAALREQGIGTAETCGTLWRRGMNLASADERGRFKALEIFHCPRFDHCYSAVLQGCGLVSGVMWRDRFRTGPDGWLLLSNSGSAGGHAVFGYKPTRKGQTFGIWHQNSWTAQWGLAGRCVFPESLYQTGGVGGWWALRSVTDEGGIVPPAH